MKKQLLSLGVAFAATLISVGAMAAVPTADLKTPKSGCAVVIDGMDNDAVWASVDPINVDLPFRKEAATVTSATWKALWTATDIFVVVKVEEAEAFWPSWASGLADWQSDKIEIYFDVNLLIADNGGASGGLGNIQVAPNYSELNAGGVNSEPFPSAADSTNARYNGSTYVAAGDGVVRIMEYQVPVATLLNADGAALAPAEDGTMGFDVTVVDLDEVMDPANRQRLVWSNDTINGTDESWNNMDGVGVVTFTATEADCITSTPAYTVDQSVITLVGDQLMVSVEGTVTVYNTLGQKVMSGTNLSVAGLNSGVYIVTVGKTSAKILVK